jgi:hypothetical protein
VIQRSIARAFNWRVGQNCHPPSLILLSAQNHRIDTGYELEWNAVTRMSGAAVRREVQGFLLVE